TLGWSFDRPAGGDGLRLGDARSARPGPYGVFGCALLRRARAHRRAAGGRCGPQAEGCAACRRDAPDSAARAAGRSALRAARAAPDRRRFGRVRGNLRGSARAPASDPITGAAGALATPSRTHEGRRRRRPSPRRSLAQMVVGVLGMDQAGCSGGIEATTWPGWTAWTGIIGPIGP